MKTEADVKEQSPEKSKGTPAVSKLKAPNAKELDDMGFSTREPDWLATMKPIKPACPLKVGQSNDCKWSIDQYQ